MSCRSACAKRLLIILTVARWSAIPAPVKSLFSESDFQKRRQDPKTRDERATQCSGNFRFPTPATSMINRHFQNAQPCSGRFHLHLQIPTVGFFTHSELCKRISPDGPERRHIGVTNAVKRADQKAREMAGKNLLRIHAPGLASPAGA